jgi:hypothetical protein
MDASNRFHSKLIFSYICYRMIKKSRRKIRKRVRNLEILCRKMKYVCGFFGINKLTGINFNPVTEQIYIGPTYSKDLYYKDVDISINKAIVNHQLNLGIREKIRYVYINENSKRLLVKCNDSIKNMFIQNDYNEIIYGSFDSIEKFRIFYKNMLPRLKIYVKNMPANTMNPILKSHLIDKLDVLYMNADEDDRKKISEVKFYTSSC